MARSLVNPIQLVTNDNFQRSLVRFSSSHGLLKSSRGADDLGLSSSEPSLSVSTSSSSWGVRSTMELQQTTSIEQQQQADDFSGPLPTNG